VTDGVPGEYQDPAARALRLARVMSSGPRSAVRRSGPHFAPSLYPTPGPAGDYRGARLRRATRSYPLEFAFGGL